MVEINMETGEEKTQNGAPLHGEGAENVQNADGCEAGGRTPENGGIKTDYSGAAGVAGTASGTDGQPAGGQLSVEERLAALEAQVAAEHDLYLRKAADFDNYRKRTTKEKQDAIDFANQSLLLDLIPILDDFERAVKTADSSQKTEADFTAFLEGVGMIEKRLRQQLENKWQLKRFESAGESFDPEKHEALMMEKSPDITEAAVLEDFVKGYMLKGRVIRPAKVKVIMPE
ncbi:MAG: nucleotide exchange factor GrpE [Spirochaetaceae bacterium]|jgi:molecular chaperone GrpE|nr:nucleotide exchange factor GrpE [Spirochaetaceae bacterium]